MSLICPGCKKNTLKVVDSIEFLPDGFHDEISLQVIRCGECEFQGLSVYRESRRGAWDSESWINDGYIVNETDFQTVANAVRGCPDPSNRHCQCSTHLWLEQTSEGRWDGLAKNNIHILGFFDILVSKDKT